MPRPAVAHYGGAWIPIVAEARTANTKTARGGLRLSINRRKDSRPAHRVFVRTLTVAALVILGIGGASAAMDSGPPMQPAGRSTVLTEGIRCSSDRATLGVMSGEKTLAAERLLAHL